MEFNKYSPRCTDVWDLLTAQSVLTTPLIQNRKKRGGGRVTSETIAISKT